MSKKQLSMAREPKSLKEVLYQRSVSNTLKKYLRTDNIPQALYLYGPPGTGKTSTAKAFIRTLRCLNRNPGEVEPCGECQVCKSQEDIRFAHPSSNVLWIQRGKSNEQMKSQIDEITDYIQYPPEYGGKHKFVVIDELQTLSPIHIQTFLFLSESGNLLVRNGVIFIFITMNNEKISDTVRDALTSRAIELPFTPPTEDQVLEFLKLKFDYPEESLRIIAKESDRNMRKAYSLLERCLDNSDDNSLDPIEVADTLHLVDDSKRIKLWTLIQKDNYSKAKEISSYIKVLLEQGATEDNLIRDLIQDVQFCIENQEDESKLPEQCQAVSILSKYYSSVAPIALPTFLVHFSMEGVKPVDIELLKSRNDKKSGYARLRDD